MPQSLTPYSWPAIFASVVLGVAALLAWYRRPMRGAGSLALTLFFAQVWALGQVAEINATSLATKYLALQIEHLAVLALVPQALIFVLRLVDVPLTRARIAALWAVPLAFAVLVITHPRSGGWLWTSIALRNDWPFTALRLTYGTLYDGFVMFARLYWFTGVFVLLYQVFGASRLQRRKLVVVLCAHIIPTLFSVMFVLGLGPVPYVDLTPFALSLSALAYLVSLYGSQLFDLAPVARSALIESMRDGVIVVDPSRRCVDINPAARHLLGLQTRRVLGAPLETLVAVAPQELCSPDGVRTKELRTTQALMRIDAQPLFGHHAELDGWLLILRDISEQRALETENRLLIEESLRRATEAETLRQAGAAVAATLKQAEAVPRVLNELRRVVQYDTASVLLVRGDALEIIGGAGFERPHEVLGLRFALDGDTPAAHVYRSRCPILFADAQAEHTIFHRPPHTVIRSWLGVPLTLQDRAIGMLTLDSRRVNAFNVEQLRLATAFADHVAIALEHARLFEHVQRLATIDPLTEIYNRRHFFEIAAREIERARRYNSAIALILFDIDYFKRVNDTYGHLVGDRVLQAVAQTVQVTLRSVDIFARYGGEEFIVLLPETELDGARLLAERLRQAIAATIVLTDEGSVRVSISLGVGILPDQPSGGSADEELERLIERADSALYRAKQAGRNRAAAHISEL